MNGAVAWPWMAEIGIVSWRSVVRDKRPPLPSELLATFVIFGAFSIVSVSQPKIGSALGWGIVIATGLSLWDPTDPTHKAIKTAPAQSTSTQDVTKTGIKGKAS